MWRDVGDNRHMDHLRDLARELAVKGGELAARMRAAGVTVAATKSSDVDVVTRADQAVERMIREELAALRPDDAVHGEEESAHRGTSGLTWVVDPIDGTVNYLYGLPHWCVSVAVVTGEPEPESWEIQAAAVSAPALATVWDAARGQGACRDGVRLPEIASTELDHALLATGFGYDSVLRGRQGAMAAAVLPHVRDLRRLGSCALDLCLVASGSLDVYAETGINGWDMAAGALIAQEAGAVVHTAPATPQRPRLVTAGHPHTVAQLESILAGFFN